MWNEHVQLMQRAVIQASTKIQELITRKDEIKYSRKEDGSLVMSIDLASDEIIQNVLGEELPLISEEEPSTHELLKSSQNCFLVDPVDGTSACKRFMNSTGGQVGFGPLIGKVENGRVTAAVFGNIVSGELYTAAVGKGTHVSSLGEREVVTRQLKIKEPPTLRDCGVLFYPGKRGELKLVEYLHINNLVDTFFRFGGFASDCTRLANGYEQILIQLSIKPWDAVAALFPVEAGATAIFDPEGGAYELAEWNLVDTNPVVICPKNIRGELVAIIKKANLRD